MIDNTYFKKDAKYRLVNDKYIFKELSFSEVEDSLDLLKSKFKKFNRLYDWLIKFASPVFLSNDQRKFISIMRTLIKYFKCWKW